MTILVLGPWSMVQDPAFAKPVDDRVKALEEKWSQHEATKVEQNARVAESIAQLDRIRAELQTIIGNVETQNFQMKQLVDNNERHYRDLEMRMNAMESQLKLFQNQLNRALATVSPKLLQETKDFQKGLDQVQRAEYQPAIQSFQEFLKKYPKSPQRDEAQFWVAECRYGTKDFTQSIKDYQKFVEQFPKSSHAPTAVLKQGDGFLNLQMKDEAKVFYKKVVQDYPRAQEAATAKGKLEALEKTGTAPTVQPSVPPIQASPPAATPLVPQPTAPSAPKEPSDF